MPVIKNYDQLATNDNRKIVLQLIETAFAAITPQRIFDNHFSFQNNILKIQDKTYNLTDFEKIFLVGFGKGSAEMCRIIEDILGDKLTEGFDIDVVDEAPFKKIQYTKGTHPLPSQANFDYTENVIAKLSSLTEKDFVIVVTCGGGSVLFEKPHTFTLEQMIDVNKALLESGATISEINSIRKHLSKVKAGHLAKIIYPATAVNLIFSDVPGNDLSVIASAPLVKDPTTIADATAILEKYKLTTPVTSDLVEPPKEDKYFDKVSNILMLSNLTALNAMEKKAKELGLNCYVMTDRLQGDARTMGEKLIKETPEGQILLAGGETTLKITGKGRGGRNQTLVMSALPFIKNDTVIATFGSDGWDFYGYAGAIADKDTLKKIETEHLDVKSFLDDDNSYELLEKIGDGIDTGKLESNVSDLFIVLKK
jgi:glycerate-2-kinase